MAKKNKESVEEAIQKMHAESEKKWASQPSEEGKVRLPTYFTNNFTSSDSGGQLELYRLVSELNDLTDKLIEAFPERFEKKN